MQKHQNPDGTYDGAGVLGDLTGLGRPDMIDIWEQVKENHTKLDACNWHEFEPILPVVKIGQKYRCKHCQGEVDATARRWYELGREHERTDRATSVLP